VVGEEETRATRQWSAANATAARTEVLAVRGGAGPLRAVVVREEAQRHHNMWLSRRTW
jgi:hypothetical protein